MDLSAILTDNVCRAPLTARHCLWPLARLRPEDIDSRPDFRRCPPLQVIVRPIMVVPASNVVQSCHEFHVVRDRFCRQRSLHRPNKPLDSPILPGASRLTALVADPQQPQATSKPAGDEHGFIVRPEILRASILSDRFTQLMQQYERRLVRKRLQSYSRPAPMIDDGQGEVWCSVLIRLRQQIAAPDPIAWDRSWYAMFHLPSGFVDQILVPATGICDIGLAHGHLPSGLPLPIEGMGNRATACLWHPCLESNDLIPNLCRFRLGVSYAAVSSQGAIVDIHEAWMVLLRHKGVTNGLNAGRGDLMSCINSEIRRVSFG